jgi:hypothetical protein
MLLVLDETCTDTAWNTIVTSPTPVDWVVISPTIFCGWTRYITHTIFVTSPTVFFKKSNNGNMLQALSTGVTRARVS